MPVLLPAAAATAAWMYLDGKYRFSYDAGLVRAALKTRREIARLDELGHWNFFYILEDKALDPKFSDREYLWYEGRSWTFRQVYDTTLRYGQWLRKSHGVEHHDMVALDSTNRPNFLFIVFGLWSIGAKAALINSNISGNPLLHSIRASAARLILVDSEIRANFTPEVQQALEKDNFRDDGGSVKVVYFEDSLEQDLEHTEPVREPDSTRKAQSGLDPCLLIYTSGTTGNPKPSIAGWMKLFSVGLVFPKWLGLTPNERFYTCMPLYHSSAMFLGVVTTLWTGCTLVLGHKFGTNTFWPAVRESRATYIQYVGETCRYLLSAPPSPLDKKNNVRVAFGNGLRPDIWEEFKERFDIATICEFYGSTEGFGTFLNRSSNSLSKGAVGRPGPLSRWFTTRLGMRNIIVEHDVETEQPLRDPVTGFCRVIDTSKPNSPAGELLAKLSDDEEERGRQFPGYYRNQKATSSKIVRDVVVKGDYYYRSGDLMRIDPDGHMFFHDRVGDTYRWKSENVSTNEVAETLCAHPAIVEANVYGVQLPGHDGRAGCAAVVPRDGAALDSKALAALAQHALKSLPRYAVPLFIRVPRAMERTGTNKQQKTHLRNQGADVGLVAASGDGMYWLRDGRYVPYGEKEWQTICNGQVKL